MKKRTRKASPIELGYVTDGGPILELKAADSAAQEYFINRANELRASPSIEKRQFAAIEAACNRLLRLIAGESRANVDIETRRSLKYELMNHVALGGVLDANKTQNDTESVARRLSDEADQWLADISRQIKQLREVAAKGQFAAARVQSSKSTANKRAMQTLVDELMDIYVKEGLGDLSMTVDQENMSTGAPIEFLWRVMRRMSERATESNNELKPVAKGASRVARYNLIRSRIRKTPAYKKYQRQKS